MHETIIANRIIEEASRHGKVREIHLEIGELAHVPASDLLKCLKELVGWKIISSDEAAKARCDCGFEGHPDILDRGHDYFYIECPRCRNIPDLVKGQDIKIMKVVVD